MPTTSTSGAGMRLSSTWDLVREDYRTHGRKLHPGMHALVLHRLGQLAHAGDSTAHRFGQRLYALGRVVVGGIYSVEIPVETRIGRRLYLPHPHGVVFNGDAVIGDDCLIRHNVTLGAASLSRRGAPALGNGVQIGPGAVLMGDIAIGDGARIGPNALVVADVPAGGRVVAAPASIRAPSTEI